MLTILKADHCNSIEDRTLADFVCECSILRRVVATWKGWADAGMVVLVMTARWHALFNVLLPTFVQRWLSECHFHNNPVSTPLLWSYLQYFSSENVHSINTMILPLSLNLCPSQRPYFVCMYWWLKSTHKQLGHYLWNLILFSNFLHYKCDMLTKLAHYKEYGCRWPGTLAPGHLFP